MPPTLRFADHATRDDLRIYLERLSRAGRAEVRLVTRRDVLAVFGCTQAPESLIDPVPTVLVLRSFTATAEQEIDAVVTVRALLDRLARMGVISLALEVPEVAATAAWAGVLPPVQGWQPVGVIDADSLAAVAEEGMRRIAEALPDSPGEAVVLQVRRSVWGSEIAPGLPAAAAFAAEALGFLGIADEHGGESEGGRGVEVRMSTTRTWRRLSTERGEVLVRGTAGSTVG